MALITFPKSDETSLFDGADATTLATVNVPASIAKFEDVLTERINQTYPDAGVEVGQSYYADMGDSDVDDEETAAQVQRLAEELFDDGNLWMVEA